MCCALLFLLLELVFDRFCCLCSAIQDSELPADLQYLLVRRLTYDRYVPLTTLTEGIVADTSREPTFQ